MKKVILSAAILISSISTHAQTQKGIWLLGGTASFNNTKYGISDIVTSLSLAPGAGYFVLENFAVGAAIQFETIKNSYSSFAFSPFARYYFAPLGEQAKLFINGAFGLGTTKVYQSAATNFSTWELAAGPAFFINQHVALEIALAYERRKLSTDYTTKDLGLKVGFQIHLGN